MSAQHTSDWYATTQEYRPQGTPGSYRGHTGNLFEVILDRDGLLWYHAIGGNAAYWMPMRGWDADAFEADDNVPEWVIDCVHDPICDTERDCVALRRESGDW